MPRFFGLTTVFRPLSRTQTAEQGLGGYSDDDVDHFNTSLQQYAPDDLQDMNDPGDSKTSPRIRATDSITLDQLKEHFHLPMKTAAERLGICLSLLKKTCRAYGIPRWPHRKVRSRP